MSQEKNLSEAEFAAESVLVPSEEIKGPSVPVRGFDFNGGVDYDALFNSYRTTGFQATAFYQAVQEINRMIHWRLSDDPISDRDSPEECDPDYRNSVKCTIFLAYTSNMISCGIREIIRFLAQHRMVDCIVTTAGGIEEDLMKCMNPHLMGEFGLSGKDLRKRGINRIGNLLVPNNNYCSFEDWLTPILNEMLEEQTTKNTIWTPSKMIHRFGEKINNEDSVYYWCWKNNIPVFCPAITDGSIGDMLYFHSFKHPGLVVDILQDIRSINNIAFRAKKTGMIILGGGLVKHHTCNANLIRNGADFSVFVNTAQEYDGSDAGAKPDEAVSWGKIRLDANPVKVYGDAALIFPLLVSLTFARMTTSSK